MKGSAITGPVGKECADNFPKIASAAPSAGPRHTECAVASYCSFVVERGGAQQPGWGKSGQSCKFADTLKTHENTLHIDTTESYTYEKHCELIRILQKHSS